MDQRGANNRNWKGGVSQEAYRYTKRFREKFPEKARAHDRVRRAIEKGVLVRLPCSSCGSDKSQAHHADYSKPLDVTWLCRRCHDQRHLGAAAGSVRK